MNNPTAISGTRRQIRELVDGTIEVKIHIDPAFRKTFHEMFPDIDTPIALAPLRLDFDQPKEEKPEAPKGGPLANSAGQLSHIGQFQRFVAFNLGIAEASAERAAQCIRDYCHIESRAELDHNPEAAKLFAQLMAEYREWLK